MITEPISATPNSKPSGSYDLYNFLTAKHLSGLPSARWLIDDILPDSGLACLFGNSGVGKSFIGLDVAGSVARGATWFGHPTNTCSVVYVVLEGQAGFFRRVKAWQMHHEIDFPENVQFLCEPFALTNPLNLNKLCDSILESGGAGLIIIDTLNKAAPGADENSSVDMGKILAGASHIQQETNALVLLVHHSGKDATRGLRGHSSLGAAADAIIEVEKDGLLIRWNLLKSKDGEDGISHSFKLETVEVETDPNGKVITSCVIQEVEGVASCRKLSEPRGVNQKAILAAVQEIMVNRRMQLLIDTPDCLGGILFDDLLTEVKDVLIDIDPKHRQTRTKEALEAIIRMGYLKVINGWLYLSQ